jgi:hypothetical protein
MAQAGQLGGDEVSAGTLLLGLGPRWGNHSTAPAVVDGQFAASFGEILEIVEINFSESFQQVFVPPNLGPKHIERVALFLKGTAWFWVSSSTDLPSLQIRCRPAAVCPHWGTAPNGPGVVLRLSRLGLRCVHHPRIASGFDARLKIQRW